MQSFQNSASLFAIEKTYARFPVWKDSARAEVKFRPIAGNRTESRRSAARLYHRARMFERQTRARGRQDGAIGRNGLKILEALLFDFLNHSTGRLDPGYAAIARAANISIRSVARGLRKLRDAKVVSWIRRVYEKEIGGAWRMAQDTNAYAIAPATQWAGFKAPPEPPPPEPGTWGDHPAPAIDTPAGAMQDMAQDHRPGVRELAATLERLKPAH